MLLPLRRSGIPSSSPPTRRKRGYNMPTKSRKKRSRTRSAPKLTLIDHPLIKRDLTILRDRSTPSNIFRSVLRRVASLMAYQVTDDLSVRRVSVTTPLEKTTGYSVSDSIILVPILRAGLGLVGGFVEVLPEARVGHIGLYRDEVTLKPVDYYLKFPRRLRPALVIEKGAERIRFVCLVAAPEGVELLTRTHPDVRVYTCALDRKLNKQGYIL